MKKAALTGLAALTLGCATGHPDFSAVEYHNRVLSAARYLMENTQNEWHLCLGGQVFRDTLFVNRAEMPVIVESTPVSVSYEACDNPHYVGSMHPHFNGITIPSMIDVATWERDNEALVHVIVTPDSLRTWRRNR